MDPTKGAVAEPAVPTVWQEVDGMLKILTIGINKSGESEGEVDFSVPHGIEMMKKKLGPGRCVELVYILEALKKSFEA